MPVGLEEDIGRSESSGSMKRDLVVLIHGLAASRAMLRPIEKQLRFVGFTTLNWGYPSVRNDIETTSTRLRELLRGLCDDSNVGRIHLVTHSMGSIIARAALTKDDFDRLSRIVMLAPPHGGSHVARRLSNWIGWLSKPLRQLSDHHESFVNSIPEPIGHEIGIIAAAYDRVVSIENTHLSHETDHIVVEAGHSSMLFRQDVWNLTESFLRHGEFERQFLRVVPNLN